MTFRIGRKEIGGNNPCYIIAEMSANHCGSITKALKIIKCAKKYGADAIKLQTFTPKSMTIKNARTTAENARNSR